MLLGVLDDGRLTDSKGRTVSFANTVIIMTSNLGSDLLLEHGNSQMAKDLVMGVVKQHFRPEFLNRLDDVVIFEPLGQLQLREVAREDGKPFSFVQSDGGSRLQSRAKGALYHDSGPVSCSSGSSWIVRCHLLSSPASMIQY